MSQSTVNIGQHINLGPIPLRVGDLIGSGAFGEVYLMVSDEDRTVKNALKVVVCDNMASIDSVEREINTLTKAKHKGIVQILAADRYQRQNTLLFLILTEYCSGGDLNSRLNNHSDDEMNLKWIWQISEALSYLHSLNPPIVHRDLKADNVLLTDLDRQDLKLGDFGLAREYLALKKCDNTTESTLQYYMKSGLGPIHWMAPEFYQQHYTEKADVFSLGGIFYAILTRDFIPNGHKKMYGVFAQKIHSSSSRKLGLGYVMATINPNAKAEFSDQVSKHYVNASLTKLIANMLDYHPHNRPSAIQVKTSVENISLSFRHGISPPFWGYCKYPEFMKR